MLRNALSSTSMLLVSLALPAQAWNESGDAGDLPRSAQVISHWYPGALPSISGTLAPGDVDMYLLYIADVAGFTATTVGGAVFDTQLFLFFPDGRGVTHNDDTVGTTSTIGSTNVPFPGLYYLAISGYNRDPIATGNLIWNNQPFLGDRRPDGPHRYEPVDGWAGNHSGGAYTIALTGCMHAANELVAPDNHHLTESATQVSTGGNTNWWRSGGGRFQILYEASHFTNAGVGGYIYIDQLMFRGESGEPNLGGQQWANVTLQLARTPMTAAGLGVDFAANLAAATTATVVIPFPTVTVDSSIGSTPNNYNIRLNIPGGSIYVPALGNLLIDVVMPTPATLPPASGPVMPMEDASGVAAFIRGTGVSTANPAALTGTLSANPLVVAFKIASASPSTPAGGATPPIPARNEFFGAACGGSPSTFYQTFLEGQAFDLIGLTLTPDNPAAPSFYQVTPGAGAFDATQVNAAPNTTGDDVTVLHPLGFAFNFPGGSTADIRPCTNGYVWLNGTNTTADFTPTLVELLGGQPRLVSYWRDLHAGFNNPTHPNSGLHVLTTGVAPNRVCYVTWFHVGSFNTISGPGVGGHSVLDFQVAIFETTNVVEFRYGRMPPYATSGTGVTITGFTRGIIAAVPSVDPQSRDLSVEVPFATRPEGTNGSMGQRILATPDAGGSQYGGRAFAGQSLTFNVVNVPPGTVIGAQLLDFAPSQPGINIPGIHAPGCVQSTSLGAVLHQLHLFPPSTVVGTLPIFVPAGFEGFELYAQYAVLDGLFGGPSLVTSLSNAVRIRFGRD